MTRRSGATLIEVLVAIFVMGIGMIALLTLFPLGALRMADAIQFDKCTTMATNATAIATLKNIRNDATVRTPPWLFPPMPLPYQPLDVVDVFTDKILLTGAPSVPRTLPKVDRQFPADPEGPSYAVFVDPVGYMSLPQNSNQQLWVADGGGGNYAFTNGMISRGPPSFCYGPAGGLATNANIFRWFALLDDLNFDTTETTGGVPLAPMQRDIRYTCAYMVQRPRSMDPSIANCAVVVYRQRPLSLTQNLQIPEATFKATFNITKNTITLDSTGAVGAPNVRVGDWLLDSTYVITVRNGVAYGHTHAYFYRVVGVTEGGPNIIEYEVQQPIRGFPLPPHPPIPGTPSVPPYIQAGPGIPALLAGSAQTLDGGVTVLEGVVEVYERGLDRKLD